MADRSVLNTVTMNLEKYVKDMLPRQVHNGLVNVGTFVTNEAKERCGVDTNTLRPSIHSEVDDGDNSVTIGTNVDYAPYHHDKNPFLQDAVDENMSELPEVFMKGAKA